MLARPWQASGRPYPVASYRDGWGLVEPGRRPRGDCRAVHCDATSRRVDDRAYGARVDGVAERHRRPIVLALALALLVRAVLGFADAIAIARGGVRVIPTPEAVAVSTPSPLWPALLAVLALAAGARLPSREMLGWVLAVAACVGYLVSGIADLGMLRPAAPLADVGFWLFFVANLVVPAVVLAALLAAREWFAPSHAGYGGRWSREARALHGRVTRGPRTR